MKNLKKGIALIMMLVMIFANVTITAYANEVGVLSLEVSSYTDADTFGISSETIRHGSGKISAKEGEKISVTFTLSGVSNMLGCEAGALWDDEFLTPGYYTLTGRWKELSNNSILATVEDYNQNKGWSDAGSKIVSAQKKVYVACFSSDLEEQTIENTVIDGYDCGGIAFATVGFSVSKDIENIYDVFDWDSSTTEVLYDTTVDTSMNIACNHPEINDTLCTVCGKDVSLCFHKYTVSIVKATCTDDGYATYSCDKCGDEMTTTIPATGHSFHDVTTEPTCTDDGYTTYSCDKCGVKMTTTIPATGHDFQDIITEPTCTRDGSIVKVCKCGYIGTTIPVDPLGHKYGEWIIVTPATEKDIGLKTRTCIRCDAKEEVTIPVIEHIHSHSSTYVEPTCTERGYTIYKCENCNYSFTDNYTEPKEHSFTNYVSNNDATCTEDGTETAYCDYGCGLTDTRVIPDSSYGHSYNATVVDSTCTEKGYTTHSCKICNDSFKDNYTDPLGHDYSDYVSDNNATCIADGTETRTCARCNTRDSRSLPNTALGHIMDAGTIVKEPTCTGEGEMLYKCENGCGYSVSESIRPTFQHAMVYQGDKREATCLADGYTGTYVCSKCDFVLSGDVIPKKPHVFTNYVSNSDATCTEDGERLTVTLCEVCGEEFDRKSDIIPAKGHTEVVDKAVAPACSETGLTKGSHCSVCGEVIVAQQVVEKKGHTEVVDKAVASTCVEAGLTEGSHCSVCGEVIAAQETIDATGHKTETVTTKATLSKNGKIVTKCTVCGTETSTKAIAYPKTISLKTTAYTYDGKVKKPAVTVKDSTGKTIAASNYTVTYSNNKNVGKASAKITFKGNYSGTKTLTFKINPKGTTLSGVTAASKGFTAKWKKQATQTTGYEIQYSTDKNFKKGNKTVTVSKNSTTSKKVTKLKAKKKYYVRIRTYKTVSGTKYYSAWSASKAVTTKK